MVKNKCFWTNLRKAEKKLKKGENIAHANGIFCVIDENGKVIEGTEIK